MTSLQETKIILNKYGRARLKFLKERIDFISNRSGTRILNEVLYILDEENFLIR